MVPVTQRFNVGNERVLHVFCNSCKGLQNMSSRQLGSREAMPRVGIQWFVASMHYMRAWHFERCLSVQDPDPIEATIEIWTRYMFQMYPSFAVSAAFVPTLAWISGWHTRECVSDDHQYSLRILCAILSTVLVLLLSADKSHDLILHLPTTLLKSRLCFEEIDELIVVDATFKSMVAHKFA